LSQSAPLATDSLQHWLDYWTRVHVTAIDLGLERVLPVAHALNVLSPSAKVISVAGTNGKGSTTSTLAGILAAAGHQVGLYQSPHIQYFNERIRLNGQPVADQVLIDAFVQVEQARQQCQLSLSFFEATTLAAFLIFKQQQCDVWVLEVGLGGRLDVVNIIDADVAVITNIGLDHVEWLGDSIEKIAFEKAGIIRRQIPVVFAAEQDLPQAIAQKVADCEARLYQLQQHYHYQLQAQHWYFATPALTLCLPHGHLAHINQSAAIMAALLCDLNITQAHIEQALRHTRLAGRFEQRRIAGHHLILDVAHNPHGVDFLKQQLMRYLQLHPEIRQVNAVFSMLADKDIDGVVERLADLVQQWYIAPLNIQRAATIEHLEHALRGNSSKAFATIQQGFAAVLSESAKDQLILVCGSFHTLEAVWECLVDGDEQ
jgi:dihydrofolate synthase/folylpolyglutamate synthase